MEKYYSEKKYLIEKDKEAISILERDRIDKYQKKIKDSLMYEDTIKMYDSYISLIVDFLISIGITSELELCIALSYLIKNGCFSIDNSFDSKKTEYDIEIESKMGMNIILGEGCCRNMSCFARDILNNMNLFNRNYYCIESFHGFGEFYNRKANHVANLIKFDGLLYIIDIYNNGLVYSFINKNKARRLSTLSSGYLIYKPYFEYLFSESTFDDILRQYNEYENDSEISHLNPFENERMYCDIIQRVKSHKNIIEEFSYDTMKMKKDMSGSLRLKRV